MDKETAEQLRTTKALYDAGVLTEEEYNRASPSAGNDAAAVLETSHPCAAKRW